MLNRRILRTIFKIRITLILQVKSSRMIRNYWILQMAVDQNESDELIKSDQFVGPNMDARQIEVL